VERCQGPLEARAKVNLYLHVTGRRADGYHELDSLFVRVDVADRIWLSLAERDALDLTGPFGKALAGEPEQDNLVMRAVDAVRRSTGYDGGFCVRLEKNLPPASGLGGGSADAAAALKGAASLLGGVADLHVLAQGLGADVPPCLHDKPVRVSGIGEIIAPVAGLPAAALVLVNPGTPLSTPTVFAARQGAFSDARSPVDPLETIDDLVDSLALRSNDLEAPACQLAPSVSDVLTSLRARPGVRLARMSGSGATCFGLTATLDEAQAAAETLRCDHADWWVAAAPMIR
jgi:4-diphosphocytidyl-2-C-methyl-D-erythritol kinase